MKKVLALVTLAFYLAILPETALKVVAGKLNNTASININAEIDATIGKDSPAYDMLHSWEVKSSEQDYVVSVFPVNKDILLSDWIKSHTTLVNNKTTQNLVYFGNPSKSLAISATRYLLRFDSDSDVTIKLISLLGSHIVTVTSYFNNSLKADLFSFQKILSTVKVDQGNITPLDTQQNDIFADLPVVKSVASESRSNISTSVSVVSSYKLPWTFGISKYVTQSWNGSTHIGIEQYAYDFGLSSGDTVLASAGGQVSAIQSGFTACGNQDLGNSGNYVVINHADNTATLYLHLQSVNVTVGQTVNQGQVIGLSGLTGYTDCHPHLHFQRQAKGSWYMQSQSIYFAEYPNQQLQYGSVYTSQNTSIGNSIDWSRVYSLSGDYDNDHKADVVYFDSSAKKWHVKRSGSGWSEVTLTQAALTTPIPVGDFDWNGDGIADMTVFDQLTGRWEYFNSSTGIDTVGNVFGWSTCLPVGGVDLDIGFGWSGATPIAAGDYDNDHKTDLAIFDRGTGHWYIRPSAGGSDWNIAMGWSTTVPIPGLNYNSTTRTEMAIFDRASGTWYLRPDYHVSNNDWVFGYGNSQSIPI